MGGAGIQIPGELDKRRLQPIEKPRTIVDRILFRTRIDKPREIEYPGGGKAFEVPCDELIAMEYHFKRFLKSKLSKPWPASKHILSYLDMGVCNISVRGSQEAGEADVTWNVDVVFSGCAGMADTAAELACHWVSKWFGFEFTQITREILIPFGFVPDSSFKWTDEVSFMPLKHFAYAGFHKDWSSDLDQLAAFELDGSVYEVFGEDCLQELKPVAELMRDGRCRCQLCMPNFDISVLNSLSI
jgi:hypothetical protein